MKIRLLLLVKGYIVLGAENSSDAKCYNWNRMKE